MTKVYLELPRVDGIALIIGVESSSLSIEEMIESLLNSVTSVSKMMEKMSKK